MADDFVSNVSGRTRKISSDFDLPHLIDLDEGKNTEPVPQEATIVEQLSDDLQCEAFTKVFVLWRPWEECSRCTADVSNNIVVVPTTGEYTCPHNQEDEYKNVKDIALRGRYILQREEFFKLKDGTLCAHLVWVSRNKKFIAEATARAAKAKEMLKNQVYPPQVEFKSLEEIKKDAGAVSSEEETPLPPVVPEI
jgi:hypothetical protein